MLLPSAFPCDSLSYFPRILSPPLTPTSPAPNNLQTTCFALQSLLASSTSAGRPSPRTHCNQIVSQRRPALQSPIKLVAPSPSRGQNKRRRSSGCENTDIISTISSSATLNNNTYQHSASSPNYLPSTPKRRRLFPPSLPRGLNRSDFDALYPVATPTSTPSLYSNSHSKSRASPTHPSTPPNNPFDHCPPSPPPCHLLPVLNSAYTPPTEGVVSTLDSASPMDPELLIALILQKLLPRQREQGSYGGSVGRGLGG